MSTPCEQIVHVTVNELYLKRLEEQLKYAAHMK